MSASAPYGASILLLAWAASAVAGTANSGKGPVAYRWVDEQGIVHYGDRVPPQYSQQERTVLNSDGVEVRRLEAQKTPEQLAAEARQRDDALRLKQHDSFLLTTYTSVKDIEALRDQRLDQLKGQQVAAQQYVDTLHSRLSALQARAVHFKPYSDRADARQMPDDLAEDLVRTLTELRTQSNAVVEKGEEQVTLRSQFQADIERYRQLHVLHEP
ncbi:MAG TPA: DUF4124 domain-containing protein [Steroidobacteraceae bacterium]|nr:DUF4124 domain-containing protein [Steroidobacteraceae bacterium]